MSYRRHCVGRALRQSGRALLQARDPLYCNDCADPALQCGTCAVMSLYCDGRSMSLCGGGGGRETQRRGASSAAHARFPRAGAATRIG